MTGFPRGVRSMLAASALALALGGCAVGPDYRPPERNLPEHFQSAGAGSGSAQMPPVDLTRWWKALNDPDLDALVTQAIRDNPDIEVALNRLQQARTLEAVVTGEALPQVEAGGAAGRGTGTDLTRGRVPSALTSADTNQGIKQINYVAGFDAGWTLDLFGMYRRQIEAAHADAAAAAAARADVMVAVIANVARGYIDLRGLQVQQAVLRGNIAAAERLLDVVQQRYEHGITNALDVALARRQLATLRAEEAPLAAQVDAARNTLATLSGRFPEQLGPELSLARALPKLPDRVEPGLPVDLLRRRPDVQLAERSLAAATARVGVATAQLLPHLSLTGAIGAQGQGIGVDPIIGRHIWSVGAGAYWPLLDFGILDGLVDIADQETRVQLAHYRQTVLQAVQEVDTAVSGYRAQRDRLLQLDAALAASHESISLATQRYERGLTDFLNVLDAEREEYDLEGQYANAQQSAGEQWVALYRALGGGWEDYQAVPPVRIPQPAVVAAFRRLLEPSGRPAGTP